jgi:hypothetical protein
MGNHFSCVGFYLPSAATLSKLVEQALKRSETTWSSADDQPSVPQGAAGSEPETVAKVPLSIQYERWQVGSGVELWLGGEGDKVTSIAPHFAGQGVLRAQVTAVSIGVDYDGHIRVSARFGKAAPPSILTIDVPDIAAGQFREGESCTVQCAVFAHEVKPSDAAATLTCAPGEALATLIGKIAHIAYLENDFTERAFAHLVVAADGECVDVVLDAVGLDRTTLQVGQNIEAQGWLSGRRTNAEVKPLAN